MTLFKKQFFLFLLFVATILSVKESNCQEYYFYDAIGKILAKPNYNEYSIRFDSTLKSNEIDEILKRYNLHVNLRNYYKEFMRFEVPDSLIDSVSSLYKSEKVLYLRPVYNMTREGRSSSAELVLYNEIVTAFDAAKVSEVDIQNIIKLYNLSIVRMDLSLKYRSYIFNLPYDKRSHEIIICAQLKESGIAAAAQPNILIDISVKDELVMPQKYSLNLAYPNPFNAHTTISFELRQISKVNISIYNILGQKVAVLVNEILPEGRYERVWNPQGKSSGIYFVRMEAGNYLKTIKITLLK